MHSIKLHTSLNLITKLIFYVLTLVIYKNNLKQFFTTIMLINSLANGPYIFKLLFLMLFEDRVLYEKKNVIILIISNYFFFYKNYFYKKKLSALYSRYNAM